MQKLNFGLTCSPSKIIESDVLNATKIVSSYGGGMGGTNTTYYAIDIDKERIPLEITIQDIRGRTITLGYNFIVSQEPVRLLKLTHDITAHCNYRKRSVESAIDIEYNVLYQNEEFTIDTENYKSENKRSVYKDINRISLTN